MIFPFWHQSWGFGELNYVSCSLLFSSFFFLQTAQFMAVAMREQLPLAQAETERACFLSWSGFGSRAEPGSATRARTGGCKHEGCFGPATTASPADGGALHSPHRQDRRAFDALITQNYAFLLPDSAGKSFVRSSCFPGGPLQDSQALGNLAHAKTPLLRVGFGLGNPPPQRTVPWGAVTALVEGLSRPRWGSVPGRSRLGHSERPRFMNFP